MSLGKSISYPHHHPHHHQQHQQNADTLQQQRQSRNDYRATINSNMSTANNTCYPPVSYELQPSPAAQRTPSTVPQKDYSRPLHVDCSVEYELPNAAKPPQGVRNEPLLMIHPCYFRKIESQRRSPFINNLPARPATALKRRGAAPRGQQLPQQVPVQAAPYPVQYQTQERSLWDPPQPPIAPSQPYCKREVLACAAYTAVTSRDSLWEPDCSPERPEDKHILSGKYRQYLRAHRLHPYVSSAISTFPHQIQQVCYNV
ncbi:uncharacterized protein LOC126743254 [Anthonomus grandis grandis]|uniref:uncharacterized protein LOC126743254 n=1 Tax=Anthonomus grandis grandis TaxID=2921223 RepID=UPI002165F027|nr:uncharacterized protein LOC126743254 [Anthonomus grandis grandis]